MTTQTTTAPQHLVELARLTRIEYERRILLDACHRALDAIPEGEMTDADHRWAADMYGAWADAWEQLATARKAGA